MAGDAVPIRWAGVALFDVVRKQLAIRKARKRARENPSPSTLAELAQTYFDREQPQQAFRSLQHAVNLYPDSELLRDLAAHLRRSDFERQVRMLGQLVEESPEDPNAYLALAEIYLGVRDTNKVLEVVTEGLERCPGAGSLLLVGARARLERFARDFSERDCLRAVEELRQVLAGEPENYPARRLLGQVYYLLGYHRRAVALLEPYAQYNPWDERARDWLNEVQAGPGPSESLVLEQAVARTAKKGEFPVDVGWEPRAAYAERLAERPLSRELVVEVPSRLGQVLARKAHLRAAVWRGAGGTEMLERREGLTEENVLALAEVAATGERACLDMDIGRLERAIITGPTGTVVVVGFANGILVALFSEALRSRYADSQVTEALREAGALAAEVSRA